MERLTYFDNGRWMLLINGVEYVGFPFVDRLAAYEDAMSIDRAQELAQAEKDGRLVVLPPPNDPLTLEELREMDGEPVWVTPLDGRPPRWCFVVVPESVGMGYVRNQTRKNGFVCDGITGHFRTYGKTWLAYRRKPEEEQP